MTALFSGGPRREVGPTPAPPMMNDPSVKAAQAEAGYEAGRAKGRRSTILSSALGDTSAAPVARKTLLGGG
jgi:hypothetical protein